MSTAYIDFTLAESDRGPPCASCSAPTRLIGIEPHPTAPKTDLRTYQCLVCEHMQVEIVPLAT